MDLREPLRAFGLSEKRIDLYLALLTHGTCSAQRLADETGLIRQVVYDTVRDLLAQGLATSVRSGRTTVYRATEPVRLVSILQDREAGIRGILPHLERLNVGADSVQSDTTAFNGAAGLKTLLYSTLDSKEPLYWISNYAACHAMLQEHVFYNYTIKRIERKLPLNILIEPATVTPKERPIWRSDAASLRVTREHVAVKSIPATYILAGDTLIILNMAATSPYGLRIRDPAIVQSQKVFFDLLWESGNAVVG